jgi:hypothetical protein
LVVDFLVVDSAEFLPLIEPGRKWDSDSGSGLVEGMPIHLLNYFIVNQEKPAKPGMPLAGKITLRSVS